MVLGMDVFVCVGCFYFWDLKDFLFYIVLDNIMWVCI